LLFLTHSFKAKHRIFYLLNQNQLNMKVPVAAISLIILFSSCAGSADKKVPELAGEMCDCFTKFQTSLSPEAKDLMKAVSVSANPQAEMMTGMQKLKPEDAADFASKMQSIGTKGSDVYACMEAFDKKHGKETTADKKGLTEKLLAQMQANGNCPVGAGIINLSLAKDKK
jgi:hypothetical protein